MNKQRVIYLSKIIVLIILIIACIYILNRYLFLGEIIGVVLISFIIAYCLKPVKNALVRKFHVNPRVISALLVLSILGFIGIFVLLFVPTLFKESLDIEGSLNGFTELFNSSLNKLRSYNFQVVDVIYNQTSEKLNSWIINTSNRFFDLVVGLWENIITLAVVPVMVYYFLADGEMLKSKLLLVLPANKRNVAKSIGRDIDKVLGRYIFSQLILSLIIVVLTFIGLLIVGVKFPLWLSLINGMFNIIPYFGPIIGAIPAMLIAFIMAPSKAIGTAIVYFIIQQLEGDLIAPKITGESISMHPVIIILLLLLGENFGGIFGMVLAIPVGVIIKVIYEDVNYYLF